MIEYLESYDYHEGDNLKCQGFGDVNHLNCKVVMSQDLKTFS